MGDPRSSSSDEDAPDDPAGDGPGTTDGTTARSDGHADRVDAGRADADRERPDDAEETDVDEGELRRRVDEKYDFDDFGPEDMEEMSAREWEAAFDADSWVTGDELLDRVADDLRSQIASREVFAVLEEVEEDGERRLLAYSDEGYAVVYPDGGIAGFGTVLRDVKPTVALCSMESYTPAAPPDEEQPLPDPEEVAQGTGEFGNLMLQVVAAVLTLTGLGLLGAWVLAALTGGDLTLIAAGVGVVFVAVGVFLFGTVANARLSDRFRAEEYRERLRTAGVTGEERPPFVPVEDGQLVDPDGRQEPATLEAVPEADRPDDGVEPGERN